MIKQSIHSILKLFNIKVSRIPSYVVPTMPFDLFEHVLSKVLQEVGSSFRFVQVGANDGVMGDNLAPLIRKYGLTGCLVEPMYDVFERLKLNYKDQPQLTFCNTMIGSAESTGVIHRFKPNAPVPAEFFHGLARQDSAYIKKRAAEIGLSDGIEEVQCKVKSLRAVFDELNYKCLHLLYIDTEGSDDMVIYQALDAKLHPFIINYEWTEMGVERNYKLKMRLLDEGYRFIDVGADTVCVRQ